MGTIGKKKKKSSLLLSKGKSIERGLPKTRIVEASSFSAKAGRTLIRRIHVLNKRRTQALRRGETKAAAEIEKEIEKAGGLEKYQQASLNGQSKTRGGDSSHVLLSWLSLPKGEISPETGPPLRVLEIGALSPNNAISKSELFSVTRIDLHSTHPDIETQDFMQRPLPTGPGQKFHLISLSLVLNFVPTPDERGNMLRRLSRFLLLQSESAPKLSDDTLMDKFPSVFIVLPAPCVLNSRYLNKPRFSEIMNSLGYQLLDEKISSKLIYQLWKWVDPDAALGTIIWKKEEVNPGKDRNNFAITFK